jgi:hypothetical protein
MAFDPRQEQIMFPLASAPIPAVGPTNSPVQWVPGVLPPGLKSGRGATLTTHHHIVPRSRTSTIYSAPPPPQSVSMACSGTASLYLVNVTVIILEKRTLLTFPFAVVRSFKNTGGCVTNKFWQQLTKTGLLLNRFLVIQVSCS